MLRSVRHRFAVALVVCALAALVHHFAVAQTPPIHPRLLLTERQHVVGLSSLFSDAEFRRAVIQESRRGVGRGQFFVGDRQFRGGFEFGAPNHASASPNPSTGTPRQTPLAQGPTATGVAFTFDVRSGQASTTTGARLDGSDFNVLIADPRGIDFLPVALNAALSTLEAEFSLGYAVHQIVTFRRPGIATPECTVLIRLSSPWDTRYVMVTAVDLRTSFGPLRIVTGG